jgi:hypothetical protein
MLEEGGKTGWEKLLMVGKFAFSKGEMRMVKKAINWQCVDRPKHQKEESLRIQF